MTVASIIVTVASLTIPNLKNVLCLCSTKPDNDTEIVDRPLRRAPFQGVATGREPKTKDIHPYKVALTL